MNLKLESQVCGFYKIEAVRPDGSRRLLADWFPNLITNSGLDRMGQSSSWYSNCKVGTGSATPAVTDTAMSAYLASSATTQSSTTSRQSTSPYYVERILTKRFAAGVATGNISEVGMGWAAGDGNLFSRALILDGGGSPTSITVLSDEALDVTYRFRIYPPIVDTGGTVTLASVGYNWVGRASEVTGLWLTGTDGMDLSLTSVNAYDGAIGSITAPPSGSSSAGTVSNTEYAVGSYTRSGVLTFGLAAGNLSGGIDAVQVRTGSDIRYQFGFTPAIPKTSSLILTLNFSHSWARKSI